MKSNHTMNLAFRAFAAITMKKTLNADMTMKEIMDTWPATIRVVLRRRMLCIGCPISNFHTLVDAANEYFLDPEEFEAELKAVITDTGGTSD